MAKKSIITDKLYPIDIFIYNRIKFFNNQKNKPCFESNKSLSVAIGRSVPRISNSVNKLIKLEYVENKGTNWARQLYITNKELKQTLNLTDMSLNKNDKTFNLTDKTNVSEMLISLYLTDKTLLTKAIRDFNKNDNIVKDSIRLELIDIVKEDNISFDDITNFEDLFSYWDKNKKGGKYKTKESYNRALSKLKELTENNFNFAKLVIDNSISNNYQGFARGNELFIKKPNNLTSDLGTKPKGLTFRERVELEEQRRLQGGL